LKSAPAEFQELRLEVLSLNTTLQALADESSSPTSIILLAPPQRQESLRILLENCTKGLRQLDLLLSKSSSLAPNEKTRFLEHIRFASKGKQGPRDKLAIHTASINIFLTSLTHSSLGRLELLIKNALRGGEKGALSALSTTQEPDAWSSIGRDLALEGISSDVAVKFKHEIEAYTRHLANGGDPFWAKSRPTAPNYQPTSPQYQGTPRPARNPQYQDTPQPQGAPPKYEANPSSSVPSTSQQRPGSLFGNNTQSSTPSNQTFSFGQTPAPQYAAHPASPITQRPPSNPQQQPVSIGFGNSSTPQQQPQSTTEAGFGKPESGFGGFGSQPAANTSPVTGGPFGSGSQQQPSTGGFGAPKTDQKPGGLFGSTAPNTPATGGGLFGQPAQQNPPSTGGLFGSKPVAGGSLFGGNTTNPSSGLFGSPQSQNNQTNSALGGQQATTPGSNLAGGQQSTNTGGNAFGNQPSASSENPFGNPVPARPAFGSSTGYGSGENASSLFGGGGFGVPQIDNKQVEELSELFDHIFDIDEDVAVVAQGARPSPYLLEQPIAPLVNEARYIPPLYTPPIYVPQAAPLRESIIAQNIYQQPQETRSLINPKTPSITNNADTAIKNNLLHTVRLQLEQVVIQYCDAQRAGDSRRVDHLLQTAIPERVQYLRNAGAILIQCDLCHVPITDGYYHCDICANGDWDCCPQCLEQGKGCLGGHGLGRRNKDWVGEKHWMRC
jgi:hypothetical protein